MTSLADFLKQGREDILRELGGCGEDLSELYKRLVRQDNEDNDKVATGICIWGVQDDNSHRLIIEILNDDLNYLERVIISDTEKWQRVEGRKFQSGNTYLEFEERSRGTVAQISYQQQEFKNKTYCDKVAELLDEVITKMYGLERQRSTPRTVRFEEQVPIEEETSRELTQLGPYDLYQRIVKIAFNIPGEGYSETYDGEASLFDGDKPGTKQLALKVNTDDPDMSKIKTFLRNRRDNRYTVSHAEDGFSIKVIYQSMPQRTDIEAVDACVKDILNML
jgi:hypothetical protein